MYTFPEHVHTYASPKNMCAFPKDTGVCMSSGKAHKQMYAFPQKYTLFTKTHLFAFPENIFYRTASRTPREGSVAEGPRRKEDLVLCWELG